MESNKYQALRERLIEVNPTILTYNMGSILKDKRTGQIFTLVYEGANNLVVMSESSFRPIEIPMLVIFDEYENMGRPIRLTDVLLAIGKGVVFDNLYWVNERGEFGYFDGSENANDSFIASWNLKDDNLDNQSEQTLEFLYELLVNQKQ